MKTVALPLMQQSKRFTSAWNWQKLDQPQLALMGWPGHADQTLHDALLYKVIYRDLF